MHTYLDTYIHSRTLTKKEHTEFAQGLRGFGVKHLLCKDVGPPLRCRIKDFSLDVLARFPSSTLLPFLC